MKKKKNKSMLRLIKNTINWKSKNSYNWIKVNNRRLRKMSKIQKINQILIVSVNKWQVKKLNVLLGCSKKVINCNKLVGGLKLQLMPCRKKERRENYLFLLKKNSNWNPMNIYLLSNSNLKKKNCKRWRKLHLVVAAAIIVRVLLKK